MSKKISAEIVADSINGNGNRITTFLLTYPRFIHGEIMAHRVFSRNSASSRAIPFEKMIKMVEEDPFVPIAFQRDHKGMQGTEYITEPQELEMVKAAWLFAKDDAVDQAIGLNKQDVTKQLCNRLLEPYMWHTVLVTATEFENFFELRCPKYWTSDVGPYHRSWKDLYKEYDKLRCIPDEYVGKENDELFRIKKSESQAEIHIQALAEAMWDAQDESKPKQLQPGEWHIPFGDKIDKLNLIDFIDNLNGGCDTSPEEYENQLEEQYIETLTKIAVARCARLSYMTFDGKIDYEKDIKLHDQLLESKHFSPFEHIAKCMDASIRKIGPTNLRKEGITHIDTDANLWSGNLKGWIQYRQLVQ
jgi:thymidylate synthase ThyX